MKLSAGSIRTSDALPKQHGAWRGARCWHPASTVLSAPAVPAEAEDSPRQPEAVPRMDRLPQICWGLTMLAPRAEGRSHKKSLCFIFP